MYPVVLKLKGRRCLVVGAGSVAIRKVKNLVAEEAHVTVVAPEVEASIEEMARRHEIELEVRPYESGEAAEFALVIAATDKREVNRKVYDDADAANVWVNVADDPELCSFHLPARVLRGPLQITISTEGQAPFVARRLRRLLDEQLDPAWEAWMDAAARFRSGIRSKDLGRDDSETAFETFFERTVDPERLTARVPTDEEMSIWSRTNRSDRNEVSLEQSTGFVSLVGAGPGNPGLLTLKARRRLQAADVVVYDRLAASALPADLPNGIVLFDVGKRPGVHQLPQEEINALLVRLAKEGKRVVRLKGGDPFIFGRGGEEAETLVAAGVPFDVVSGVTSGVAAAAWAGIPVTHRRHAVRVTLLTAHEAEGTEKSRIRWDLLAKDPDATIVGYMGVTALPRVVERLLSEGIDPATPAAVIERGTMARQRLATGELKDLLKEVEAVGIKPPAIFVIGRTAGLNKTLAWYSVLPLAGERFVVTAGERHLMDLLDAAGAEVVPLLTPMTAAARVVLAASPITGCVVSSPDEVYLLDQTKETAGWNAESIAWCLGQTTAERAKSCGWKEVHEFEHGLSRESLTKRIKETLGH